MIRVIGAGGRQRCAVVGSWRVCHVAEENSTVPWTARDGERLSMEWNALNVPVYFTKVPPLHPARIIPRPPGPQRYAFIVGIIARGVLYLLLERISFSSITSVAMFKLWQAFDSHSVSSLGRFIRTHQITVVQGHFPTHHRGPLMLLCKPFCRCYFACVRTEQQRLRLRVCAIVSTLIVTRNHIKHVARLSV